MEKYDSEVKIVDTTDFDFNATQKFYQKFLDNPYLIEGRMFDIGVYVLISSINPLRVYRYGSEIFLRFCPKLYHPFNEHDLDSYVIKDSHKHFFEIESIRHYSDKYGYSSKQIFDDYLTRDGHDFRNIWTAIDGAINRLVLRHENAITNKVCIPCCVRKIINRNQNFQIHGHYKYKSTINFFQLVRFDFLFDEFLNPYIQEVHQGPNMITAGDRPEMNAPLHERLIHDTMKLVGAGSYIELMLRY